MRTQANVDHKVAAIGLNFEDRDASFIVRETT